MDLFTDRNFKPKEVEEFLSELFPKLVFFNWDFTDEEPKGFDSKNQFHINYQIEYNSKAIEFQNCITIYRLPTNNMQQRFLFIGKKLSDKYGIRVLIGYTIPGKEDDPYYDIIFDGEKSYLVEDFDTNFGGWTKHKKLIKVENEYPMKLSEFDEYSILKASS